MPEFIPRPQLPTGLAQQLIQMLQVNPYAGAIESLGKSISGAIDARGDAKARAAEIEAANAFRTQQADASRQADFGEFQAKLAMGGNLAPMLQAQLGIPNQADLAGLRGFQGQVPLPPPVLGPAPEQGLTLADLAKMWGVPEPGVNQRVVQREKVVDPLDVQLKEADLAIKQERLKPKAVDQMDVKLKEADLAIKKFKIQSEKARANRKPVEDKNLSPMISVWGKLRSERADMESSGIEDPQKSRILDEKISNVESQLKASGIPMDSKFEDYLKRGRKAIAEGRMTEEELMQDMEEDYPSLSGRMMNPGKNKRSPFAQAMFDAIPGMSILKGIGVAD